MAESGLQSNGSSDAGIPRIRRRNRMITSCLECRRRKLKCDKLHPCTNCSKFSRDCMFLAPALDSVSQKKLNELKDKMGSLEKVLENDIARKGSKGNGSPTERNSPGDLPGEDSSSDKEASVPDDERPLEFTPLAVSDAAYEDTANEDLLDLGVWVGRMRLNERFGGTFRPRFAEEIASALGEPINKDMNDPSVRRLSDHEDFLAPGPSFIAPGSGFVFGDIGPRRNLIDFLPSKAAADALVQKYYQKVHFIAKVVHWPSFQLQYENFWTNILSGYEPQHSLQAIVFAVLFSAVASADNGDIYSLFGSGRASVLTNFQTATEVALGKANYLRTSKIETLQALVIYLIPMVRDEVSRAHSVLIASAVRLGECMGLHRDPEIFGMSPINTHNRRTLWFQLCYLDFRSSETQAPRPYIKRENYDTRFPLDINDLDLMTAEPRERTGVWTDMTLSRLRFECAEIWRVISGDMERLRKKRISITHALGKVESFRHAMETKYSAFLDTSIPIQAYARHFVTAAMSRTHVTILHRFHHSVHVQIPDRLREVLISHAIETMEHFIEMQKRPEFMDWAWYSSSVMTWNPAMLLLIEIFVYPQRRDADRVWAILDFTYQPDLQLTREQKACQILATIRDRAAYYRDIRQLKEPKNMGGRQLPTIPIRRARGASVGPDSILPKHEDSDMPYLNGNGVTSGSSSRKHSLTSEHADMAGGTNTQHLQPSDTESWTFDNSSTLFVPVRTRCSLATAQHSRIPSVSPLPPTNASLPQRNSLTGPVNIPGLDYSGNSPGSSSTNTDAWPPPLNENQGWKISASPGRSQADTAVDRRVAAIQPAMAQMSNAYIPQGYPANQLPFMTAGHSGVEAMLQPPSQGYLQDETMSLDIDWGEWDKIFPPDVNAGNMEHPQIVAR